MDFGGLRLTISKFCFFKNTLCRPHNRIRSLCSLKRLFDSLSPSSSAQVEAPPHYTSVPCDSPLLEMVLPYSDCSLHGKLLQNLNGLFWSHNIDKVSPSRNTMLCFFVIVVFNGTLLMLKDLFKSIQVFQTLLLLQNQS